MAHASPSLSSLVSIVIVFADGRERVQVRSTPQWAALPYLKAFNSHTGTSGNRAELRTAAAAEGGGT